MAAFLLYNELISNIKTKITIFLHNGIQIPHWNI